MERFRIVIRICLYILLVPLAVSLVVLSKLLFIFLADQYLHSLPVVGEIFQMLDLSELSNLISFAILGLSFGISTAFLPPRIRRQVSLVLLIPAIPFVFSISTVVRYNNWINDISQTTGFSSNETIEKTNNFLVERTNKKGLLGFYIYTAKFPLLPTQLDRLDALESEDNRLKSLVSKFLGDRTSLVNWVFGFQGWLLRLVYAAIAIVTTIIHYQEGCQQLERFLEEKEPGDRSQDKRNLRQRN